jgi:hypothetical protein
VTEAARACVRYSNGRSAIDVLDIPAVIETRSVTRMFSDSSVVVERLGDVISLLS